jgi:hypothetical protein
LGITDFVEGIMIVIGVVRVDQGWKVVVAAVIIG